MRTKSQRDDDGVGVGGGVPLEMSETYRLIIYSGFPYAVIFFFVYNFDYLDMRTKNGNDFDYGNILYVIN